MENSKNSFLVILVIIGLCISLKPVPQELELISERHVVSSDLSNTHVAVYYGYPTLTDRRVNESRTALFNMFQWMNATVSIIDWDDIENGALWGFEILAMPEGLGPTIERYAGDDVLDDIRNWVASGGSYIGVRGSAAIAVKDSYYEGSNTSFHLALVNGISYEVEGLPYQGMTNVSINRNCINPDLSDEPENLTVCSITGRYFEAYEGQEITIIANYSHINQPAMIASRYGNGTVFLSSPHFEYEEDDERDGSDYMDDFEDPDSEWPFMLKICNWLVSSSPTVRNNTWPRLTTSETNSTTSTVPSTPTSSGMTSSNETESTVIENWFSLELGLLTIGGIVVLISLVVIIKRKQM